MRVLPNGHFATAEDGSDRYIAERIGLALTVRRGERREVPDYGIGDLEYEGLAQAALENQIEQFGPPAIITDVIERTMRDGTIGYEVQFAPLGDTDEEVTGSEDE